MGGYFFEVSMDNTNATKKIKVCQFCKKEYNYIKDKTGIKYCSRECAKLAFRERAKKKAQHKKINHIDPYVSRIVTDLITKIRKAGNTYDGVFIDYWNVGDIGEVTRQKVLARDDYHCQICSCSTNLHLHHIIPRKYGGNHSENNLITLCASCHRHIETGDLEHAIKTCSKNRQKYYYMETPTKTDKEEKIWNSLYILNNINKELVAKYPDETELLIRLDKVISNIEEVTE